MRKVSIQVYDTPRVIGQMFEVGDTGAYGAYVGAYGAYGERAETFDYQRFECFFLNPLSEIDSVFVNSKIEAIQKITTIYRAAGLCQYDILEYLKPDEEIIKTPVLPKPKPAPLPKPEGPNPLVNAYEDILEL